MLTILRHSPSVPPVRITDLTVTIVAVPFAEPERWAFGVRHGLASVILEVTTDEGVVGIGEAAGYPTPEVVVAVVAALRPLVVGEDPQRVERIIKLMDVVGTWHHVGSSNPALGAVEMACWDIVGKVCGQPLVNLFGGRVRDRVSYFHYLARKDPAATAADAAKAVASGFRTCYLKVGWGAPADDIQLVEAITASAGPDLRLRVDANESWSTGAAVRTIAEMERFGLELVEQPVSGRNLSEMAYVRSRISTPLLANEASWTRQDALEVIRHGAADVISVDNQMDGGLFNMKRAAGICEAAALPVVKHSLGELGVATYAALHVIASTPNFLYANQAYGAFLTDDVLAGCDALPYEDGHLAVPDGPGIGVTLDRDKMGRYAELYARDGERFSFRDPNTTRATPVIPKA